MRVVLLIASIMLSVVLHAEPGNADGRVALVIGNTAYRNVAALSNTANDAADIAAAFRRLGFVVTTVHDGTFDQIRRALLQFGRDAHGADIAVVYFAGHGMEVAGENWLIPIDAELRSDNDAENEAIALKSVMLQVSSATGLGLVILDSCRNNPFAAKMQRLSRVRAVDRGLVRVEPTDNVMVAYAAKDGTVASDGRGRNSPFTAALLNNLEKPGLEIRFLLAAVRDEVLTATDRQQQPFTYGSLSRQPVYLIPPSRQEVEGVAAGQTRVTKQPQPLSEAAQAWQVTQSTTSIAVLEDFIRQFGNTPYGSMASARINELRRDLVAPQLSSQPSASVIQPATIPPIQNNPCGDRSVTLVDPIPCRPSEPGAVEASLPNPALPTKAEPKNETLTSIASMLEKSLFSSDSPQIDIGPTDVFHEGDVLRVEIHVPRNARYLDAFYLQADGNVLHLTHPTATLLNSGYETLVYGDGKDGRRKFTIQPPYGVEMIIALASRQPVFGQDIPEIQSSKDFLTALRRAFPAEGPALRSDKVVTANAKILTVQSR